MCLGALVGLSLGALGAGGSILTVPALVLVLGQSPHEAAATSLVVVGSVAATGAIEHRRRSSLKLRAGLAFAAAGVAGSLVGSLLSIRTDPAVLALAFAGIMLVAAASMWRASAAAVAGQAADVAGSGQGRTLGQTAARTLLAGGAVGFLTGFFGIGGGFLAVPALIWAMGLGITTAIGTSLLVICLNAAVALVPRLGEGLIDPLTTTAFVAGGVVGALAGAHLAHRTAPDRLKRAFALAIAAIALALAADTL